MDALTKHSGKVFVAIDMEEIRMPTIIPLLHKLVLEAVQVQIIPALNFCPQIVSQHGVLKLHGV